jgi:hypothetical protein
MTGQGPISEAFKLAVLRAMPDPPAWVTVKRMYQRLDTGAISTIKQALLELSRAGKIAKFGDIMDPAFQRIDTKPTMKLGKAIAAYRKNLEEWKAK